MRNGYTILKRNYTIPTSKNCLGMHWVMHYLPVGMNFVIATDVAGELSFFAIGIEATLPFLKLPFVGIM